MIEQTDTEQADPVLKTTSASTVSEARQEAAAPLGKPAAAMQPELAAGVEPLVRARQALGLGASDIAAKLGMATRQIEALERGDWQALPGQAFVRGALRSYGKSVGVDVAPLLAAIGGQVAAPELRSSASLDAAMPKRGSLGFGSSGSGGSGGRLIWIVLGVAAVIAMALYFGDAFEIGRSVDRDEAVVAGGDARSSADGAGAGGPAASGSTSGAATRAAGSQSASSGATASGGSAQGAAAPAAAASGSAAPGTAASGATGVSPSGDTSGPGGGFARLAPLTPLVPLAPAPSATQAAGSGAMSTGPGAEGAGAAAGASAAAGPATAAAPGAADESDSGAATPGTETRSAEAGAGGAAGSAAAPSTPAGAGSASGAAAAGDSLRLRFDGESWVDIRDGAGKVLLQGTQAAGSSRDLSGAPPFKLVIGNAAHVSVERNGQAVELGKRTRSGVARLTLE